MTQSDLAKALNLTRQRVSQLVKKGMPTESVKKANAWRIKNNQMLPKGPRVLRGIHDVGIDNEFDEDIAIEESEVEESEVEESEESNEITPQFSKRDPKRAIEHLQQVESRIMKMVKSKAESPRFPILVRELRGVEKTLMDLERVYLQWQIESGEHITLTTADKIYATTLRELQMQLNNLPDSVASVANPKSPDTARRAIKEGLVEMGLRIDEELKKLNI